MHRRLLRCTKVMIYLSMHTERKGREGEKREKERRKGDFGHWHVFMETHGYHNLDRFTHFWGWDEQLPSQIVLGKLK